VTPRDRDCAGKSLARFLQTLAVSCKPSGPAAFVGARSRGPQRAQKKVAMKLDFTDQVVIVTGAGSGIGKAAAMDFAKAGAIVVSLDVVGAKECADEIASMGLRRRGHVMDVRNAAAWSALVGALVSAHGKVDVLVNMRRRGARRHRDRCLGRDVGQK